MPRGSWSASRPGSSRSSVRGADGRARGLHRVARRAAAAAEARRVLRVRDVRQAPLVDVDAEVVEQLATAGAADPALADRAGVDRHQLLVRPGACDTLGELHVPGAARL